MRKIALTQGQHAIVDDDDYEFLNQWKWHARKRRNTFYAERSVWVGDKRKLVGMHRIVNKTPDGLTTDHVDGNGLNNCKCNLRTATYRQNNLNRAIPKHNTSGYRGVTREKGKWCSQITVNGRHIRLGSFENVVDAAEAYNNKYKELMGMEFRERAYQPACEGR